ncbi:unnamed protein product [Trichobilharzia regenti]|nr:unnamed protein product [Trichobilharzia regenti]
MIDAISCPLNITLFLICALLTIQVPKMGKRDFTLEELQKFDGKGEHKRILIAVNGKIFDVTNNGQEFYGKGAPYAVFAGKDASRALACFNLETKNEYDDLSDLTPDQMKTLREWELQFSGMFYLFELEPLFQLSFYVSLNQKDNSDPLLSSLHDFKR